MLLQEFERHIVAACDGGVDPLYWHDLLLPLSDEIERRTTLENEVGRRMSRQLRQVSRLINEVAARIRALEQLQQCSGPTLPAC